VGTRRCACGQECNSSLYRDVRSQGWASASIPQVDVESDQGGIRTVRSFRLDELGNDAIFPTKTDIRVFANFKILPNQFILMVRRKPLESGNRSVSEHTYYSAYFPSKTRSFYVSVFPFFESVFSLFKSIGLLLISISLINLGVRKVHFGANNWSGLIVLTIAFIPFFFGFSGILFGMVAQ